MSPRDRLIRRLLDRGAMLAGDPRLDLSRLRTERHRRLARERERAESADWLRRMREDERLW